MSAFLLGNRWRLMCFQDMSVKRVGIKLNPSQSMTQALCLLQALSTNKTGAEIEKGKQVYAVGLFTNLSARQNFS